MLNDWKDFFFRLTCKCNCRLLCIFSCGAKAILSMLTRLATFKLLCRQRGVSTPLAVRLCHLYTWVTRAGW